MSLGGGHSPDSSYRLHHPFLGLFFGQPNSLLEFIIPKFQHKPSHMNGYYHPKLHSNKFFDLLLQPILEINSLTIIYFSARP
jgi:hypothetical protein